MSRDEDSLRPAAPPARGRPERDLHSVNEKLQDLVASLQGERRRYERRRAEAPADPASPAAEPADPERNKLALALEEAREALDEQRRARERLQERLEDIEREHRRICDDYVAAEERSTDLASQLVALSRLYGALNRAEVVAVVKEIVVDMVGSEELAIYEIDAGGGELVLSHAFGVDASRRARVRLGEGAIGRAAAAGEPFVAWERTPADDPELTACIPLKAGGRLTGALAIYRLLEHKAVLQDLDRQIFDLLGTHAGAALHVAALRERDGLGGG